MENNKAKRVSLIQQRIDELIRAKAYEIWLRDGIDDPIRNWHQAQRELLFSQMFI